MTHSPAPELEGGGSHGVTPRKLPFDEAPASKRQKIGKKKRGQASLADATLLADVAALFAAQTLKAQSNSILQSSTASVVEASTTEVVAESLNKQVEVEESNVAGFGSLPEPFTHVEVEVVELSSTGDGLAIHPSSNQIYVVPYTVPGDIVKAKVYKHIEEDHYTLADFVSVIKPSPLRDDSRIKCKYFSKCSGCQFQMLDYDTQLKHKRTIIEKAFKNFSKVPPKMIPQCQDTIGSPIEYGYRTKLTPHFDGPPGCNKQSDRRKGILHSFEEPPAIGFTPKGRRTTLDIEDCPIGTDAVRMGMKRERVNVVKDLHKYHRGATILLRESTLRVPNTEKRASTVIPNTIKVVNSTHTDFKSCITESNSISTEYVDGYIFTSPAGAFFQNNNGILPKFIEYIREHILGPPHSSVTPSKIKYLVDAYSGSGLFTILLSSLFTSCTGVDVVRSSIECARRNAALNNLPPSKCAFMAADAAELFQNLDYPSDETVVVLDPPRKGCDEDFLRQMLQFGPRRAVYVSCDVHTQARDVGVLVKGNGKTRYAIESIIGFDFFPQTHHVEGVAILTRVDEPEGEDVERVELH